MSRYTEYAELLQDHMWGVKNTHWASEAYLICLILFFSFLFLLLLLLEYILVILLEKLVELWISTLQFVQRFVEVLLIALLWKVTTETICKAALCKSDAEEVPTW